VALLMTSLDENEEFMSSAKENFIDNPLWTSFVGEARRSIVKSPQKYFPEEYVKDLGATFEDIINEAPAYLEMEKKFRPHKRTELFLKCRQDLFDRILEKCKVDCKVEIAVHRTLCDTTDFRKPEEYVKTCSFL
jgi:hypothetical protein